VNPNAGYVTRPPRAVRQARNAGVKMSEMPQVRHRALRRPAGLPWEPSRNQRAVLRLAIQNPGASDRELARMATLHRNTIITWRGKPEFRAWWNREMVLAARQYLGPALQELVAVISDPATAPSVKVKACQVFFDKVGPDVGPHEASTAVLIEAFGPNSKAAIAMRDGATGDELKVAVQSGPGDAAGEPGFDPIDDLVDGQRVGAVEVTRHPEAAERAALDAAREAAIADLLGEAANADG